MSMLIPRGAKTAHASTRNCVRFSLLLSALLASAAMPALAQQAIPGVDIVLTPNRSPVAIQRSGSAIDVVTAQDIARTGAGGVVDALRLVPGLSVTQNGGPAAVASVRIRGGGVRHTLVLIDGVRMNDPSVTAGEFDFGMLSPTDIERIEVLRGPQSALYGSDAMGGVINIITRRGSGAPRYSLSLGGGSYGTFETRGSVTGSTGPWRYAASTTAYLTDGFSSYGHRLPRLASRGPFEKDGATKIGASLRLGYQANPDFTVDASLTHGFAKQEIDSTSGDDRFNKAWANITAGQVNARLSTLEGLLTHRLSLFGARTERNYHFSPFFAPRGTAYDYIGLRAGAEYQGDLKLGAFGILIAGMRIEQERFEAFQEPLSRGSGVRRRDNTEGMNTLSAFALHQITLFDRLDLSLAGRVDHVDRAKAFPSGRVTANYRIEETGTRLRASLGTGAKSPTLYQLFSIYGKPSLSPETSIGYDAGIEQSLLKGRIKLGLGVFGNRYRDYIEFGSGAAAGCTPAQAPFPRGVGGCYYNVARVNTRGIEATLDADLVEERVRLRASYTFLDTENRQTRQSLIRQPMHQGTIALDLKPHERLTITPSLVLKGKRWDDDFDAFFNTIRVRLAPYARLDLAATYKLNETFSLYARTENLTGARIEEVRNYGGTGRAYYGGLNATW
jgi:vitamin B12 transporter